jgi:FkbM family methyltransferase
MYLDWRDYSDASYLVYQTFEDRNTKFFVRMVREGDSVIDIGASRGWFSFVSANLSRNGKIIAVEPLTLNAELISRAIKVNGFQNVVVENVAAGERQGSVVLKGLALNSGSQTIVNYLGNKDEVEEFATITETVSLDTVESIAGRHSIVKCRIVKIDVQGAELHVLHGMQRMLQERNVDYFLIEYTKDSGGEHVKEFLKSFGYSCFKISSDGSLMPATNLENKEDYVYSYLTF